MFDIPDEKLDGIVKQPRQIKNLYLWSVIGGQALQLCLAQGENKFRYMVFEQARMDAK